MQNRKHVAMGLVAVLIVVGGVWFILTRGNSPDMASMHESDSSDYILMFETGTSYKVGEPNTLKFMVHAKDGSIVRGFEVLHTKIMHCIIVREDLTNFQHLHPDFDGTTGHFTLNNLRFGSDGPYRIFADFAPSSGIHHDDHEHQSAMEMAQTLSTLLSVGDEGKYKPEPLGDPRAVDKSGSYTFTMKTDGTGLARALRFLVQQNGAPVKNLQPYLGAMGHAIVLGEGDLAYVHAHPEEATPDQAGAVSFAVQFPREGKYKIFAQFQHQGKVLTANFVADVK